MDKLLLSLLIYLVAMGSFMWLFMTGRAEWIYRKLHIMILGVKQVTFEQVYQSVASHNLEFNKKYIEIEAPIEKRNFYDSVMLGNQETKESNKVWWYVRTGEKQGHDEIYGYEVGLSHKMKLYIRNIEYRHYENDGAGRYYVWSKIVN